MKKKHPNMGLNKREPRQAVRPDATIGPFASATRAHILRPSPRAPATRKAHRPLSESKTDMKSPLTGTFLALALCLPALAQAADPAKGEAEFRKCRACHMIRDDGGNDIMRGGTIGPNLWNIIGQPVGSVEGYAYGDSLAELAQNRPDLVWSEQELASYVADPRAWLQEKSGNSAVRTKMTFKLTSNQADMAAYLAGQSAD